MCFILSSLPALLTNTSFIYKNYLKCNFRYLIITTFNVKFFRFRYATGYTSVYDRKRLQLNQGGNQMLTPRQKRIIKYLTQQEDFTSVRFLAEMFNVSDRTIQYDLEHIEDAIQRPEVRITRNKGKGVIVRADDELLGIVSDVTEEHLKYYSAEERFEQILLMLFESLNPISSGKLSADLNVTRRTIVDDLKSIHQWLKRRKLELNYVRNKGFN